MNDRIKELRKTLGLTLEKFGERIGVQKAAVSRWEHGDNISEQVFKSICREFSVNEDWLRNGTGEMFDLPEDRTAALVYDLLNEPDDEFYQSVLELISVYQQLAPESRKILRETAKMYLESIRNRKA